MLHFRHWLERHELTKALFDEVGRSDAPDDEPGVSERPHARIADMSENALHQDAVAQHSRCHAPDFSLFVGVINQLAYQARAIWHVRLAEQVGLRLDYYPSKEAAAVIDRLRTRRAGWMPVRS